ncbi:septum formation inhibitor Maf [Shewanella sp. NKUCC05_KAH]|uniref:Maf family protein n=1 Tax=Shewanella TaxID=22 RepID=UPI0018E3B059|nr:MULTISPECIES: Maf family protein [unclassified Shewanella]MBI1675323.1 septum formation inhibitor Maf [Shewanella sp. DW31]MBP8118707.1 septum formation inhibitor Maf [Shewanella sp.]MBW3526657.1 septum formation inhibitor Maf [Shewanella sp. NKUCC05_KAH]MCU8036746.1 Maf family nucleotide pyrophosphatase [Shewanella sp. SM71]MCU8039391.1 Maf family nucleotide pyrophosphatase [Shewanella sp. SM69]
MDLVLASTSPRRKELLAQIGFGRPEFSFTQVAPDIDETVQQGEAPRDYVRRLAAEKAQAGLALCADMSQPAVLGSDTIVVLENQILGKPLDVADAKQTLSELSGRTHTVMTAVALTYKAGESDSTLKTSVRLVETQVRFCALSTADIEAYVASKEPMDKAGSYGIQGLGGCFVAAIEGSYSGVVGLPLVETRELLAEVGFI